MTRYEIFKSLLWPGPVKDAEIENRLRVLTEIICDLMMEVEVLREAAIKAQGGPQVNKGAYGQAYEEITFLTHDACGPTSGWQKLLERFYPELEEPVKAGWAEKRAWRECLMMRRLGFTDEQIAEYKRAALSAETRT